MYYNMHGNKINLIISCDTKHWMEQLQCHGLAHVCFTDSNLCMKYIAHLGKSRQNVQIWTKSFYFHCITIPGLRRLLYISVAGNVLPPVFHFVQLIKHLHGLVSLQALPTSGAHQKSTNAHDT